MGLALVTLTALLGAGSAVPAAAKAPPRPSTPHKLRALKVTGTSVVLDWQGPKRGKGHYAVIAGGHVVRRTKRSRVTLTARSGIACGVRQTVTVVAVSARGGVSRRARTLTITTPACDGASAPPVGPGVGAAEVPKKDPIATPPGTPAPAPPPPNTPGTPATGTRAAAYWPFSATSPWNMPIGTGATFGGTGDARTASMLGIDRTYINSSDYTVPVYVATNSDPLNTIDSWQGTVSARIPAAAAISGGTDGVLTIIDPAHTYVDQLYVASKTGGSTWHAERHERASIRTVGMGEGGIRATGWNVIGGVIRKYDVDSGAIRHALVMAIPQSATRSGWVWPATSEDSNNGGYRGSIPLGSLFAIPPSVNLATLGLSADGMILAKALQNYGVYVSDTSPAPTVNLSMFAETTLDSYPAIDRMRTDLEKLKDQLRIVANNTPSSIGGGGSPRQPLAPAFG